ncbi:DUF6023 family protein [Phytohabitans rumicis]|uniref:Uncharacterized protein n=1 Tax=Phytohabitans rumicis TaxID=1076125 RepID=A0A6V8L5N4_9ACTN|nr:DUF6023 family protein [Phytohabitans rumicis]GFJ90900.1 hypothetical protein Prum_045420 [Phytohabitans rumicis]
MSLVVLAVGATVALAAGGAWWVAAAPTVTGTPRASTAPPIEPEPAVEQPLGNPADMLPEFPNTLTRQIDRLDPDESWVLMVDTAKDARYLVQYVCLGPGSLRIRIEGTANGQELYELDCGGSFSAIEVTAAGPSLTVDVGRPGQGDGAEVGVQVLGLS